MVGNAMTGRGDIFPDDGPEYEKSEEEVIVKTDSLVCRDGKWFKWNGHKWTESSINPRTGKWRSVGNANEGTGMTDWKAANLAWQNLRYPETLEERTERIRRLEAMEMQTRILENNTDMLKELIEGFKQ
jgi:hypothetical protein